LYKAIEATNDGMWDWRLNTNKVYFDARFYTMLGYNPSEFPAVISEWMGRIHPDEITNVENLLKQHLEGKSEQWLIEYRFKAKNGDWTWILNRGKVFERDTDGNPLRMVGTHSDISLRKKAEEEVKQRGIELQIIYEQLQVSEEKFRQLAENTQDVFWLRDEDQIIYLNSAFNKVWGHDREEMLINPAKMQDWIHPEDKGAIVAWKPFSAFNGKKSYIEQFRIVKPNGEVRWLWSRMFPIYNDKDEVYRLACIASDITEQKRIEEALIAAREKALESDRLKSAFLANISHEVRTPMNGIIGFAELLKDENLGIENRIQYVNIITKSSEQLLHIIDDIIDISKIESNQLNITKSNFSLNTLTKDLQVFYDNEKLHLGKGHIEIKVDIDPSLSDIQINTDESRIRQVFMNLISNALKFTEQGYIKFGFTIRSQYSIECFVEDTGIGIASDMQSVIFKRFRQIDDSLTRKFGGTGLGLAICEGLVNLLGGKIWVASKVNKGSTFFFTLPYQEMNTTKMQNRKETNLNDTFDWQGKTILVVEDDEINQEFLSAVLTPTNANIIYASTGEDAVNICLTNKTIDLVLMDIRLPKMNGYEAFTIIHQNLPDLRIIAQTAFAMTEDAARCIEIGFTDYIAKPINRKLFLSMINNHLDN
jgi:PAS domain S-box-containing protein